MDVSANRIGASDMNRAHNISTVCMPVAGYGNRLREVGENTSKCLLEFGGEVLLDYAISQMRRIGITRFIFIVGHLREQVISHIEKKHNLLDAVIVEQAEQRGIVDAICCAETHLAGSPFVIYCPDNYFADYYDLRRCLSLWTSSITSTIIVRYTDKWIKNRGQFHAPFEHNPGVAMEVERIAPSDASGWVSTGFSVESPDFFQYLEQIPKRDNEKRLFDVWCSQIENENTVLAVPIEGRLIDVSNEFDCSVLRDALDSNDKGVSVILQTPEDNFLLVQRDWKTGIRYPGYWALFGGAVDPGETPEEAACRELEEELELRISPKDLRKVTQYMLNFKKEHVYVATLNQSVESLTLMEGRNMSLFNATEAAELNIRDDDREALLAYISNEGIV